MIWTRRWRGDSEQPYQRIACAPSLATFCSILQILLALFPGTRPLAAHALHAPVRRAPAHPAAREPIHAHEEDNPTQGLGEPACAFFVAAQLGAAVLPAVSGVIAVWKGVEVLQLL
jgi:hypothetical protein